MNDPIAMPIYSALLGYVIGIGGVLLCSQRTTVLACATIGFVLATLSFTAFGVMAYMLHTGMDGDPADFPFIIAFVIGVALLSPFWFVARSRLKAVDTLSGG